MTKDANQTFFLASKYTKLFNEIEQVIEEQDYFMKSLFKNKERPSNDLWIAYFSNCLGKLARTIEDNNNEKIRGLVIILIAQLISWLDILKEENFDEQILETKNVYNPAYNTILVKLVGILSTTILRNNNKEITNKLKILYSYCNQWLEKLKNPSIRILEKEKVAIEKVNQYYNEEKFTSNLTEMFTKLEFE